MKKITFSTLRTIAICALLTITTPHFTEAQTTKAELIDSIRYYYKGVLELTTAGLATENEIAKQKLATKSREKIEGIESAGKLISEQISERLQEYFKKLEGYNESCAQYGLTVDKVLETLTKEPAIQKIIKQKEQQKKESPKLKASLDKHISQMNQSGQSEFSNIKESKDDLATKKALLGKWRWERDETSYIKFNSNNTLEFYHRIEGKRNIQFKVVNSDEILFTAKGQQLKATISSLSKKRLELSGGPYPGTFYKSVVTD